ncbi:MAG: rod shape-determining protein RodA [Rectinemataceae bacterium]
MRNPRNPLFWNMDFAAFGAAILLAVIGILSIFSSGVTADGNIISNDYMKQVMWAAVGLALMITLVFIDYRQIKDYSLGLYLLFVVILVYTKLFGRVVNGARAWIGVGELGIQPSEFTKVIVILFLARYLDNSEHEPVLRRIIVAFSIVALPMVLVLSQPDFGTALVFLPILFFMLVVAGIETRYLLFLAVAGSLTMGFTILPLWEKYILAKPSSFLFVFYREPYDLLVLLVIAIIAAIASWGFISFKKRYYYWISWISIALSVGMGFSLLAHKVLKEYQVMRLIVFLDPSIDPRGSGWNILQSITAIGSGGFSGRGFLLGPQSHNKYIPQQSTDFIFSIVAEEWGFLGGVLVFGLFWLLLSRCVAIMRTARDSFSRYVTGGIMGMIFFHFMINAGMAMGIMPITGIPLFFLSYGGSSLLTVMMAVGILLGISARRYQ